MFAYYTLTHRITGNVFYTKMHWVMVAYRESDAFIIEEIETETLPDVLWQ